jgi:hypothetical protein
MMTVSAATAASSPHAASRPSHSGPRAKSCRSRHRNTRLSQGSPQVSILAAVFRKLILSGVDLVAVPAVLGDRVVQSRTIGLKFCIQLLKLIELLLLLGGGLCCCLSAGGLRTNVRAEPTRNR